LAKYLKSKMNSDKKTIKKLKQQKSHSNNLLQLADYITGVTNRRFQKKKDWTEYYRFISDKEIWSQKWPK